MKTDIRILQGVDLTEKYLSLLGKRKLYPPLNSYSAFLQGSEYNIKKYYDRWYEGKVRFDLFVYMKDGFSQVWLPEDDIRDASLFGLSEYLSAPKVFEKRLKYIQESIVKMDQWNFEYTYECIAKESWESLFALVTEVRDLMWDVNAAVVFSIYLDKKMFSDLVTENRPNISCEDIDAIWAKATEPAFESFDKAQLLSFLRLLESKASWNLILEQCQYVVTDYHSARSLADVEKYLRQHFGKYLVEGVNISEVIKLEEENLNSVSNTHGLWFSSLSDNQKEIVDYLQKVMMVRDRRKNFFAKGMALIYRVAERMFSEAGINRDLIPYYTVRELLLGPDYLIEVKDDLTKRKSGFQWLVPYDGAPEGSIVDIDNGSKKVNEYFKLCHSETSADGTIKGQSGSKGKVIGKIRIVTNINSNHGFVDGEILVTGMTRPEYVPLMKRSSAIITDEGGITCHAAIISRELKIPCVIGTKIATKVLKDGDMVEVDADIGIIKMLK